MDLEHRGKPSPFCAGRCIKMLQEASKPKDVCDLSHLAPAFLLLKKINVYSTLTDDNSPWQDDTSLILFTLFEDVAGFA